MDDLVILYEDNHVLVVLKQQNMPCCLDESKDLDLLTQIKEYIKLRDNKAGNVYIGLVHRLDRPTGGVMVFAKSSKAAARLSAQMQSGDFEKRYYTVLVGTPKPDSATLTHYLKKNAVNNMVFVCPQSTEGAKFAELEYKVESVKNGLSLTEIRLHTGRSHQIRVQMNEIGTPVYGDMRYGGKNAQKGNLALWAYYLAFTHPVTKERLVFKVQPPKDIAPWSTFDLSNAVAIAKPSKY